jgi:nucleoside-diphosphate kinase
MIKPDCVQRGLVGEVVKRFENKGYLLVAMKMIQVKYKKKQLTLIEHKSFILKHYKGFARADRRTL